MIPSKVLQSPPQISQTLPFFLFALLISDKLQVTLLKALQWAISQ